MGALWLGASHGLSFQHAEQTKAAEWAGSRVVAEEGQFGGDGPGQGVSPQGGPPSPVGAG